MKTLKNYVFFFAVVAWSVPLGEVTLSRGTVFSYLYSEISMEIGYLFLYLFFHFSSLERHVISYPTCVIQNKGNRRLL